MESEDSKTPIIIKQTKDTDAEETNKITNSQKLEAQMADCRVLLKRVDLDLSESQLRETISIKTEVMIEDDDDNAVSKCPKTIGMIEDDDIAVSEPLKTDNVIEDDDFAMIESIKTEEVTIEDDEFDDFKLIESIESTESIESIESIKTEVMIEDEDFAISESHQETTLTLQNAEVSKSASPGLCKFDCLECHKTHNAWRSLANHARKEHGKSVSWSNCEDYLYKATVHICQICSERILCDTTFLSYHFTKRHSMSLDEYRDQYTTTREEHAKKANIQQMMETAILSEGEIGNLCTYKCPGCKKVFQSKSTFQEHHSGRRKSTTCPLKFKKLQSLECIDKVVTHKCKLCSKLLLCDFKYILFHTSYVHGISTAEEYASKTGCSLQQSNRDVAHKTLSKNAKVSKELGNFCTFTCDQCDHVLNGWKSMKKHVEVNHPGSGRTMWQDYITKAVMYNCKICQKRILNDGFFLYYHLKSHKLSKTAYKKKYS